MMNRSTEQLLNEAVNEIRRLRRENELLRARTETLDALMLVLRTSPPNQGLSQMEDVIYKIEKHIQQEATPE